MSLREARVVEIGGGVVAHAELLHDAPARRVAAIGEGDDLGQAKGAEAIVEPRTCALGGEALAPQRPVELPADLDVAGAANGGARRLADAGDPEPAGKLTGLFQLRRMEAEAVGDRTGDSGVDLSAGLLVGEDAGVEALDLGVGE